MLYTGMYDISYIIYTSLDSCTFANISPPFYRPTAVSECYRHQLLLYVIILGMLLDGLLIFHGKILLADCCGFLCGNDMVLFNG